MKWWKVLGLAGMAGVAATGVIVARQERRRRAYTPDEVRARLHERFAAAAAESSPELAVVTTVAGTMAAGTTAADAVGLTGLSTGRSTGQSASVADARSTWRWLRLLPGI